MEGKHEFYKLDRTKPVKFEGHTGKINAVLVIGIVFTALILGAVIYACVSYGSLGYQSIAAIAFFLCFGLAFVGFGINRQKKYNGNNSRERSLLQNCLCTDGIINECECIERTSLNDDTKTTYYDVILSYSYYNDKNELRCNTFQHTYNYDPEFYEGQWLMIAFNDTYSAILGRFTLVKEDEERFLKNEAMRSDDDFDNLDNTPVYVDVKRKIRSAELEYTWLWAAFAVLVFGALFTLPLAVFALPEVLTGKIFPDIFIYAFLLLFPVVFTCLFLAFLITYFKKRIYFKKILKNKPCFVRGKMFASEKTYRSKTRKKVFYCYIDFRGGRHTKTISSPSLRKSLQGGATDTVVMFDGDGNSVPLNSYKIIGED